jgi:peptidylprolyl isomerase
MLKSLGIIAIVIAVMLAFKFFSGSSESNKQTLADGKKFLDENKNKPDVQETASGLQYQFIQQGSGGAMPSAKDKVEVHYHGTLIDGTVFDSSVERGATITFGLNQVIKGWTEGLQLMSEGDKVRLFIPSNLAYGSRNAGKIPANSALIFEVELVKINP